MVTFFLRSRPLTESLDDDDDDDDVPDWVKDNLANFNGQSRSARPGGLINGERPAWMANLRAGRFGGGKVRRTVLSN